jgi:AraC family transcriptional regulator, transcriptional activator of pobA
MAMSDKEKIYSLDLMYNDTPMPFVIKKMEGIDNLTLGTEVNPHRHNYYSIIWPLSGGGNHIIDFREYPIYPDHIFFVSPWQVHQVIVTSSLKAYVILFTSEFLDRNSIRNDFVSNLKLFRNSDETPPLPLEKKMADKLKVFTENMISAFKIQADMYLETIGAYLKLFLIECNGLCSLIPGSNLQSIEVSKTLVKSFRDLVERKYSTSHQVKDYAETLNVTPNYLNEVIKNSMNIPAKEFIQNRLILEAKRMVVFTEKSAKEIGFELGFEDPSHFSKFFKSNTGQTLQSFRENLT